MGSVSTLQRPTSDIIEVTPSAVKAAGIDVSVTNGGVFLALPDKTSFDAFVAGLNAKGALHTATGLTVRLYTRNNH